MISVEIGELGEILIGQFLPSLVDFRLDIGAQLKVIHPDEPLFIDGEWDHPRKAARRTGGEFGRCSLHKCPLPSSPCLTIQNIKE